MTSSGLEIKKATPKDIPAVLNCIKGLAEHVNQLDLVTATETSLHNAIFEDSKHIHVYIAFLDSVPAGFALFYKTFSTFKATPGIYLEDLFVFEKYRNKGIGKHLLEFVIEFAKTNNCYKVEWYVNNKNTKAIDFYKKMNAKIFDYKSIFYIEV